MERRPQPFTLEEAARSSPTLARLGDLVAESARRFEVIRPLVPATLRAHLKPGAVDAEGWCLLAAHPAAAAKTRQLIPNLLPALRAAGHDVKAIRIKVEGAAASRG